MGKKKPKYSLLDKIKAIGPGAVVAASFIGPGTVTIVSQAGANFGYVLLWTILFAIIATIVLQKMAAKLGIVTQKGLGEAIKGQIKNPTLRKFSVYFIGGSILLGSLSYISGDLIGTSLGISSLVDVPENLVAPFIGIIVLFLVSKGSMKILENLLTVLVGIMAVVFLTTAVVANPDWDAIFSGLAPSFPANSSLIVVSLIGTTVVPYNFFIHAGNAQENWDGPEQLPLSTFDTVVSITVGGLITGAIMITSGTLMRGMTIENGADLAVQLEPLLGEWAGVFMAIGLLAAGFSSAIASPLGASYTLAGLFGWRATIKDKRFKWTGIIVVLFGILVNTLGIEPMVILLIAQGLNGVILPIVAIYLIYVTSKKELMGEYSNGLWMKILGGIVALATVLIGLNAISGVFQQIF